MAQPDSTLLHFLHDALERGALHSPPDGASGPPTLAPAGTDPSRTPTTRAPRAQSETLRTALSYPSPPMMRDACGHAFDLTDDAVEDVAPVTRPHRDLTLRPPPLAEDAEPISAGASTLSLALLRALERIDAPANYDEPGPERPSPEFDDTPDAPPESERPTLRDRMPGAPPARRPTSPVEA